MACPSAPKVKRCEMLVMTLDYHPAKHKEAKRPKKLQEKSEKGDPKTTKTEKKKTNSFADLLVRHEPQVQEPEDRGGQLFKKGTGCNGSDLSGKPRPSAMFARQCCTFNTIAFACPQC